MELSRLISTYQVCIPVSSFHLFYRKTWKKQRSPIFHGITHWVMHKGSSQGGVGSSKSGFHQNGKLFHWMFSARVPFGESERVRIFLLSKLSCAPSKHYSFCDSWHQYSIAVVIFHPGKGVNKKMSPLSASSATSGFSLSQSISSGLNLFCLKIEVELCWWLSWWNRNL